MHFLHVVGARPNFMKAAPVLQALAAHKDVHQTLVHTGQHYDVDMSDVFFQDLGMPQPDINLGVGSGSHAEQTAEVMKRFESVVLESKPDVVIVYGDVNSTVAAAMVCAKLLVPVAHVEAGLRAFDRTMPEEINRLLTDQLADFLFTPSDDGDRNLTREGVPPEKVHLVGNVMIDTLVRLLPVAMERWGKGALAPWRDHPYGLVTLHRPSNVDDPSTVADIMQTLGDISKRLPLVFPVHPRTKAHLESMGLLEATGELHLIAPLGYLDFLAFERNATVVITDSGGIQEETTYLHVPCITVRENTERPVTVSVGTNVLVGRDMKRLQGEVDLVLSGQAKKGQTPPLWDGHASERIAETLMKAVSR